MLTGIEERTDSLAARGSELLEKLPQDQHGLRYWVRERDIPEYQAWMSSVANLIRTVAPRDSHFISELGQLLSHSDLKKGIPSSVVQKLVGLLIAFREEWGHGLLRRVDPPVALEKTCKARSDHETRGFRRL